MNGSSTKDRRINGFERISGKRDSLAKDDDLNEGWLPQQVGFQAATLLPDAV